MATLSVVKPSRLGTSAHIPVNASANGDQFPNTGKEFLLVETSSNAAVVTFDSPQTCSFGISNSAAHDLAVNCSANSSRMIGPFDPIRFNDGNGMVQVTYDVVTGVTVAVIQE